MARKVVWRDFSMILTVDLQAFAFGGSVVDQNEYDNCYRNYITVGVLVCVLFQQQQQQQSNIDSKIDFFPFFLQFIFFFLGGSPLCGFGDVDVVAVVVE
jgi:hypothetical protein